MIAGKEAQGHKLYEAYREAPKESPLGQEILRATGRFYDAVFDAAESRQAATETRKAASDDGSKESALGKPLGTKSPEGEIPNTLPSGNSTLSLPPNESKNLHPGGNLSGTFIG